MSQVRVSTRPEGPQPLSPEQPAEESKSRLGEGDRLGRYELMRRIGVGGMAEVWAARLCGSRGFQKIVAVKVLAPHLCGDPEFERLFLEEASIVSELRHPHVASVIDLGEQDGLLFLVMEWFDGLTVGELIRSSRAHGGIPVPVAVRIVMQAAAGLHAAHEFRDARGQLLGLVHSDVSSQNLLVTLDGATHVLDFGVARLAASSATRRPIVGKARYMAPEQARGDAFDRRADVFALGVVAYRLTTGAYPFRKDPQKSRIEIAASDEPAVKPSALDPAYPAALEAIVLRALEKDPERRYATANDLLSALDALPRELRASTDEDVAVFLRSLLDQGVPSSRPSLRQLIDVAGAQPPLGSDPGAGSGFHRADPGAADRTPGPEAGAVATTDTGRLRGAAQRSTVPPSWIEQQPEPQRTPEPRRHRMTVVALTALLAGVLGGMALMRTPRDASSDSATSLAAIPDVAEAATTSAVVPDGAEATATSDLRVSSSKATPPEPAASQLPAPSASAEATAGRATPRVTVQSFRRAPKVSAPATAGAAPLVSSQPPNWRHHPGF